MDAQQQIEQIKSVLEKMLETNAPGTVAQAERWRAKKRHEAIAAICEILDEGESD